MFRTNSLQNRHLISSSAGPCEVSRANIRVFILQVRKQKLREVQ